MTFVNKTLLILLLLLLLLLSPSIIFFHPQKRRFNLQLKCPCKSQCDCGPVSQSTDLNLAMISATYLNEP